MPYHDDDEDILEILGKHVPYELGTLDLPDKKGERDEDSRAIGFLAKPPSRPIGFMPNGKSRRFTSTG